MNCPDCATQMILTRASNFGDDYWYCRNCKKELAEIIIILEEVQKTNADKKILTQEEIDKMIEELHDLGIFT